MIQGVRDISTENPSQETWKHLRYFLDRDSVAAQIRHLHRLPPGRFASDVFKQAKQLAYSIRQAEEYFSAASTVGLATKPLLLYYGAVSLSRAVTLFRLDGTHSYDGLRKRQRHPHHGLDLSRGFAGDARNLGSPERLYSSLQCTIHKKEGIPWGNFTLFYESLVSPAIRHETDVRDDFSTAHLTGQNVLACSDMLSLDALSGRKLNVWELMSTLPDMFHHMQELGASGGLCRATYKTSTLRRHQKDDTGAQAPVSEDTTYEFAINGIPEEKKLPWLEFFKSHNPAATIAVDKGPFMIIRYTTINKPEESPEGVYHPDIVEDLTGRHFIILDPTQYVSEPACHMMILFCLGMLSRYYPDIWMRAVDESPLVAETSRAALSVIDRKFPNLILDQLTWVRHFIHQ